MTDRHFDQMGTHFARKIYASNKGAIRLAVLCRDLEQWLPDNGPLRVLDVGAGLGHIGDWLARRGHRLTLSDPSAEMLEACRERLSDLPPTWVDFLQSSLQALPDGLRDFDLLVCHAVLEWLADPQAAITQLAARLRPGGCLSLAFYNRDALIYHNLLKGQFRKIDKGRLAGSKRSLTPQQPLDPRQVADWVAASGLHLQGQSGIRVFHDYMPDEFRHQSSLTELLEQELRYSRHPAYAPLGRYLHWWLVKPKA